MYTYTIIIVYGVPCNVLHVLNTFMGHFKENNIMLMNCFRKFIFLAKYHQTLYYIYIMAYTFDVMICP